MSEFDDLYNKFFGNDKEDESARLERIKQKMRDINKSIFGNIDNLNFEEINLDSNNEDKLGKPTSVETYTKDGITFEKTEWKTEFGSIVKIITKENTNNLTPMELITPYIWDDTIEEDVDISLSERLEMAVKEENYELAVEIRDLISKKNKEKNEVKTTDTKEVSDDDEWNS